MPRPPFRHPRPSVALLGLLAACGGEELAPLVEAPYVPPPESCDAPDLDDVTRFVPCSTGSGIFGQWQLDELGLPSYVYGLDQHRDPRAAYPVTETDPDTGAMVDRRDHWAAFGNRRLNAMLSNDGLVEVVTQDRGVEYLNKLDPEQHNYAGGFSYLDDGEQVWSTAYRYRPWGAECSRRFGMGYGETIMTHRGVRVRRRVAAPPGDGPVVIADVWLENLTDEAKTLRHYEYWDVGRRPIEINWVVSGEAIPGAPATARRLRDQRNELFVETVAYDPDAQLLGLRRQYVGDEPAPAAQEPSAIDVHPGDPFLAALRGTVADVYSEQATFFGAGGVAAPAAVHGRAPGHGLQAGTLGAVTAGLDQPRAFILRSDLVLAPGEPIQLRFAYGYAPMGSPFELEPTWTEPQFDVAQAYADHLRQRLLYFATEDDPFLHRELAWHAFQQETSVGYRDYWQTHVVPQGSAYLYLHGADGAARDLGIFAVPLVYTDPELAKEELKLYMGIQYAAEGRFSYAFQGHGMLDDASIHTAPSDLPLFFLWAMGEYLGLTGDLAFLDEPVPFYPREALPGATVWDHVVAAIRHQLDVVGTGEHGLIRIQTGDWSDGIVVGAPDRELAVAHGESVPNTQMAVAVLPRIAELVEPRDPTLATEIRTHVAAYRDALGHTFTGEFFFRAYFGDGEPVGDGGIDLEAQVWALIGDTFDAPTDRATLIDAIATHLDDPSPSGATLWPGGQVWPAISGLLTWGYARTDPERAWRHLARNTLASRTLAFPDVWYSVWSGPDGTSSNSGWSWSSPVTPMKDFPVQNNNQHAMALLAALRAAGTETTASGLLLRAFASTRDFALHCQLLDLTRRGNVLRGAYRVPGSSPRVIDVEAVDMTIAKVLHNGLVVAVEPGATSARLSADPGVAGEHTFVVELE